MKNKNRKKPYIYDQQVVNKNDFTVYINELGASVKKTADYKLDNEIEFDNEIRNRKNIDWKDKRFSFFADPQERKGKPSHIWHIAFCPSLKPTLLKSQRAKSCKRFFLKKNIFNTLSNLINCI